MVTLHKAEASRLRAARRRFEELNEPVYVNKYVGLSSQVELMACECEDACGPRCINRLTLMECYSGVCECPETCGNRRIQRREGAKLDVFDAGKKGLGVRAMQDLEKGDFIAEYTGEVLDRPRLQRRQQKYLNEGLEHFYFMMLQTDEYIDATEKGGLARFCNHSCSPNAEIEKWIVGPKVRLGLFAKRRIQKFEEICFDYKVDRFGGEAQQCFCGEPNCAGYLGGPSQTGGPVLPPAAIAGLGMDVDAALNWSKRVVAMLDADFPCEFSTLVEKLQPKQREHALVPILQCTPATRAAKRVRDALLRSFPAKDVEARELPELMRVLMQLKRENAWLATLILQRILDTPNRDRHARILNMHGYEIMAYILREFDTSQEVLTVGLDLLQHWPHVTRNKITSSQIEPIVEQLRGRDTTPRPVVAKASRLLEEWRQLAMGYRIPRRHVAERAERAELRAEKREERSERAIKSPQVEHAAQSPPGPAPLGPSRPEQESEDRSSFRRLRSDTRELSQQEDDSYHALRSQPSINGSSRGDRLRAGMKRARELDAEAQRLSEQRRQRETQAAAVQRIICESLSTGGSSLSGKAVGSPLPQSSDRTSTSRGSESTASENDKHIDQDGRREPSRKSGALHRETDPGNSPGASSPSAASPLQHALTRYIPKLVFVYESTLARERCRKFSKKIVAILVKKEQSKSAEIDRFELTAEKKKKIKAFVKYYMEKVLRHYQTRDSCAEIKSKRQRV